MQGTTIELFSAGEWIKVPAVIINGHTVIGTGKWLKVAEFKAEEWLEREIDDPQVFIDCLKDVRSHGVRADIFTFAQKLPNTERKYPYPFEWHSVAAIRLQSFAEWWDALPQETRKNTRRAAKRGVEVSVRPLDDSIVDGIVAINNETPVRQGRRFPHYGTTHEEVKRDFRSFPDRSDLLCAYAGGELIGIAKVIYSDQIGSIAKLQSKMAHYDKRASNLLMTTAVELCAQRGLPYVTYGSYRYGNQPDTSLMQFKDRHGFHEILVPRYNIPLSAWGSVAIASGLHRGVRTFIPRRMVAVARRLRTSWYSFAGVAQR